MTFNCRKKCHFLWRKATDGIENRNNGDRVRVRGHSDAGVGVLIQMEYIYGNVYSWKAFFQTVSSRFLLFIKW